MSSDPSAAVSTSASDPSSIQPTTTTGAPTTEARTARVPTRSLPATNKNARTTAIANTPPAPTTRYQKSRDAFDEIVRELSVDMPLIMHASGDPGDADPASVRLLSELTATYIGNLVHAAIDAHAMMNQGHATLPPPPFQREKRRFPPKSGATTAPNVPYPPIAEDANNKPAGANNNANAATDPDLTSSIAEKEAKKRRITGDLFDEPMPEPKIKKPSTTKTAPKPEPTPASPVPEEDWVGVQGVDLWESSRIRTAYVGNRSAIGTFSFIFPICHDPGLYGRVLEVQQTARRSVAPLLVDPVIQTIVQEEGQKSERRKVPKKKKKESEGEDNEDDEEEENENNNEEAIEQGQGAEWPGLDSLLPVHVTADSRQAKFE